jgi:hypothetical protein
LRALMVAILCGLVGCRKTEPPDEHGARKPRVDLTAWLDPSTPIPVDDVAVAVAEPPKARQMFERSGIHVAVVGVPEEGDPEPFLIAAVADAETAGSNATILVSKRCLRELQSALEKHLRFWTVAVVIGARCEGAVNPRLGSMSLVEAGSASRVRITFDRHTRAFIKVDPIP